MGVQKREREGNVFRSFSRREKWRKNWSIKNVQNKKCSFQIFQENLDFIKHYSNT